MHLISHRSVPALHVGPWEIVQVPILEAQESLLEESDRKVIGRIPQSQVQKEMKDKTAAPAPKAMKTMKKAMKRRRLRQHPREGDEEGDEG